MEMIKYMSVCQKFEITFLVYNYKNSIDQLIKEIIQETIEIMGDHYRRDITEADISQITINSIKSYPDLSYSITVVIELK